MRDIYSCVVLVARQQKGTTVSSQPGQTIVDLSQQICKEVFDRNERDGNATQRFLQEVYPFGLSIAQTVMDGYILANGITEDGITMLEDLALWLEIPARVSTEDRMRAPDRP